MDQKEYIEASQNSYTLNVDVRYSDEGPVLFADHLDIPLVELSEKLNLINKNRVILVCQSGKRSLMAGQLVYETGMYQEINHLEGGVIALERYRHEERN